ncbi:hypothetical protein G3M48_001515 [Beauveria asiatica]|uniref:Uncharacterized protein n=1 Tax=Beauveria asiatica TaxID=1069075 RepID=A0AAW0S128_9HYPO
MAPTNLFKAFAFAAVCFHAVALDLRLNPGVNAREDEGRGPSRTTITIPYLGRTTTSTVITHCGITTVVVETPLDHHFNLYQDHHFNLYQDHHLYPHHFNLEQNHHFNLYQDHHSHHYQDHHLYQDHHFNLYQDHHFNLYQNHHFNLYQDHHSHQYQNHHLYQDHHFHSYHFNFD